MAFFNQVDLDISQVRPLTQIVMPDQPVKIKGAGRAAIDLIIGDLVDRGQVFAHLHGGGGRLFQGGRFGQIDNDLKFALVVKGQHLDVNQSHPHQGAGQEQQTGHGREEEPARRRVMDQGVHGPPVETGTPVVRSVVVVSALPFRLVFDQPDGGPGRDDKGHQQGKNHGRRGADRNGPHIGTHQPAHESHGQNGEDDRQGGQNGGVADLVHRFHGNLDP